MGVDEADILGIVRQAQSGDTESVGRLYDEFHQRIYRFFYYRVGIRETAEDLTQTVFLEMIRSLPRFVARTATPFSAWLFQIARHRLVDHYRQRGETLSLDQIVVCRHSPVAVEPAELTYDARSERVRQAIVQLPDQMRRVIQLSCLEDMDTADIAALMETTMVHVRVLKFRGIRKLKQLLNVADL